MSFQPPSVFNIYDYFLGDRIREGMAERRALLTRDGETTYGALDRTAGRVALILREEGVRPGDRVIIALPDGPSYVAALFAVLRLGAVVVMVNPHIAAEQVRYFIEYTDARAVLADHEVADTFRAAARAVADEAGVGDTAHIVAVGDLLLRDSVDPHPPDIDVFPSHPDAPAIFLFSGGTTGRPKAVVQTHRSFANTTELYGKGILGMGPADVTLSVPKLYFGYATGSNLFFPFSVGATAALFPERCTAEALFDAIARFRPTVLVNVPTMVNHMLAHPGAARQDLSCLRLATSAGEALPEELHHRWIETFGVPLLDGLGTAEMWHIFISNHLDDVRPGTLGRPVPGFEVRVTDEDGRALPPGSVGQLRVRGDSLARGYWKRREDTLRAFRGAWYVSQDMISMDRAGYIRYHGRADDMLKVGGKWLAPAELENVLLAHDAVREVAVVGARDARGLVKPAAFVVLEDGVRADDALVAELQAWARDRLEPYKYPRTVTFLPELPRTHLGKVDRGGLAGRGDR